MKFFTEEFVEFFKELEKNNNRDWFNKNKPRFQKFVKEPFELFVQDMIYKIHEHDETLMITPQECIFRIYRDIRFSKDKSPYKTHMSAVINNGGRKNKTDPGIYIEMSNKHIRFYSGIYDLDKEKLNKIRRYLVKNLDKFKRLLNDKNFKMVFGEILGDKNKRLGKEFSPYLDEQPLIANKQFYYFAELKPEKITSSNLSEKLIEFYLIARPMNNFLKEALE